MNDFATICLCPDPWCPVHAVDYDGHHLIIDGPDDLAFCPVCEMDRMPIGACKRETES